MSLLGVSFVCVSEEYWGGRCIRIHVRTGEDVSVIVVMIRRESFVAKLGYRAIACAGRYVVSG